MRTAITVIALGALAATGGATFAADTFRKLSGREIMARFPGMEFTDEHHYADVFHRDGTVSAVVMGRPKAGKWRVDKHELCLAVGADEEQCYEVWISGKNVQLRQPGIEMVDEGILRRPPGGATADGGTR